MSDLLTKSGSHRVRKVNDFEFRIEKDPSKGMKVPVTIYATDNLVSKMVADRTVDQAAKCLNAPWSEKTCRSSSRWPRRLWIPGRWSSRTDLEEGVISPGGVGYDINCGVRLLRTALTEKDIKSKIKDIVNELFTSIPLGVGSKGTIKLSKSELDELLVEGVDWAIEQGYGWKQDAEVCEEGGRMVGADPTSVSDMARKRGSPQLGSLGSGNHFLEIQKVNKIFDERAAKAMGINEEGQLTVLIHCGSRGFGHQVCSDYLRISEIALRKYGMKIADRELACVPNNSSEGEDYRQAMYCALNFAWSNRQTDNTLDKKDISKNIWNDRTTTRHETCL